MRHGEFVQPVLLHGHKYVIVERQIFVGRHRIGKLAVRLQKIFALPRQRKCLMALLRAVIATRSSKQLAFINHGLPYLFKFLAVIFPLVGNMLTFDTYLPLLFTFLAPKSFYTFMGMAPGEIIDVPGIVLFAQKNIPTGRVIVNFLILADAHLK